MRISMLRAFQTFSNYSPCIEQTDCLNSNEYCDLSGICLCQQFYQFNNEHNCVSCPGLGHYCTDCCASPALSCIQNVCTCVGGLFDINACQSTQNGMLITASHVALSAALIMGLSALTMVIYRLCKRTKNNNGNTQPNSYPINRSATVCIAPGNPLRASLTSIQIRILARLRDRPPSYSQEQELSVRQTQNGRNITLPAPPTYEISTISNNHLPPPYSDVLQNQIVSNGNNTQTTSNRESTIDQNSKIFQKK